MGTVIRSGSAMCAKMTHFIDHNKDLVIVELGAGDGVITSHILHKMSPNARLYVFEINPELCAVVSKINDHRMTLINDGAQYMEAHLQKHGIHQVDTIISALPFMMLPDELTQEILILSKKVLRTNGLFIQMHYAKKISKMYKSIFGNVHINNVPINIPPGYVFRCVKEKHPKD